MHSSVLWQKSSSHNGKGFLETGIIHALTSVTVLHQVSLDISIHVFHHLRLLNKPMSAMGEIIIPAFYVEMHISWFILVYMCGTDLAAVT